MDVLQRLQPLDILFAVVWAAIVGWGLQTGIIRQLGMLVGVYGAALVAGSAYRQGGAALAMAFGRGVQPQLEWASYAALFVVVFGLVGMLIWRAYPSSRFSRGFGTENVLGAALGAVWGALFLIAVLTILVFGKGDSPMIPTWGLRPDAWPSLICPAVGTCPCQTKIVPCG